MKVECKKHYLFHESTEQCPDCRAVYVETVLAEHSDWDDNEETKDYLNDYYGWGVDQHGQLRWRGGV